jgi:hypothetical protein
LNDCLDPSRSDSVESLDELVDCCEMDNDCEKELEEAQECVQLCFDPCIKDSAEDYLDCIHDEDDGVDSNKCSRQACLDGFLEDLEDDVDFSGDILDLKNIEKRLTRIDQDDLEDCSLMEDFVEAVCDIGDDCCERCNEELAVVVDCLINDIVIPFVAIELNTTIEECPISEDCELENSSGDNKNKKRKKNNKRERRDLADENDLIEKALSLPQTKAGRTKRDLAKEAAIEKAERKRVLQPEQSTTVAVDECQNAMTMNTIAHNITHATSKFMECVTAAAIAALPDSDTETSAAPAAFRMAAYVAAVVGSLFAFF